MVEGTDTGWLTVMEKHIQEVVQSYDISVTYVIHLLPMFEEALKVSLFADRVE